MDQKNLEISFRVPHHKSHHVIPLDRPVYSCEGLLIKID